MAAYTPPLSDMAFVLHDVLAVAGLRDPRLCRARPRLHRRDPRGGGQDRPRRAGAAERRRRPRGLRAGERRRAHARPASARPSTSCARAAGPGSTATPPTAARACPTCCTPPSARCTSAANMAFGMYSGLTHGAYSAIHAHGTRGAEGDVAAEDGELRVDRHHEPDRAARRHRPRHAAHPRRAAGRRQLPHLRPEDLHLRRRPRPRREHRPPRPRPHHRRARGRQGHLALHRAQVPRQPRRLASASATPSPSASSRRRWASTATPPA